MKACKHLEAFTARTNAAAPAIAASSLTLPRVPFVYQQHPKRLDGSPILPHRFKDATGREQLINGGEWATTDRNAASLAMAEWMHERYARHSGPIVLNIESIPLNTPDARAFWEPTLDAMRLACPTAQFGFYSRPDLDDLVDFNAPGIYPIKRVRAECWGDNEHEQTPSRYRQVAMANLAGYNLAKPGYVCCTVTYSVHEWSSCEEIREQWRLAQDLGRPIIWWGSGVDEHLPRARKVYAWINAQARATPTLA